MFANFTVFFKKLINLLLFITILIFFLYTLFIDKPNYYYLTIFFFLIWFHSIPYMIKIIEDYVVSYKSCLSLNFLLYIFFLGIIDTFYFDHFFNYNFYIIFAQNGYFVYILAEWLYVKIVSNLIYTYIFSIYSNNF